MSEYETMAVIDTDIDKIVGRVPTGLGPGRMVVTPSGKVYVTLKGIPIQQRREVGVYDPQKGTFKTIRVGLDPMSLTLIPPNKLYVANNDLAGKGQGGNHATVSVIDTQTDKVIKTIDVGLFPWAITASSDGRWVYLARDDPGYHSGMRGASDPRPRSDEPDALSSIAVIDTQTDEVIKIVGIKEGSTPVDMVYAPGGKLYVILASSLARPAPGAMTTPPGKEVIVLDADTLQTIKTISVPLRPLFSVLAPNGKLYVGHEDIENWGTLSVIDTTRDELVKRLNLAPEGQIHAIGMGTPTRLYVCYTPRKHEKAVVAILDTATDEVVGSLSEEISTCHDIASPPFLAK